RRRWPARRARPDLAGTGLSRAGPVQRRGRRRGEERGPDPHDALERGASGPVRLRLARPGGFHPQHGLRAGGLHHARGRAHGRTMAGADLTAAEALAAWLEHLAHERRCSPRTLEAYGRIGRLYIGFLETHRG